MGEEAVSHTCFLLDVLSVFCAHLWAEIMTRRIMFDHLVVSIACASVDWLPSTSTLSVLYFLVTDLYIDFYAL